MFWVSSSSPITRRRTKGINSALGENKRALARGNLAKSEMSHLQGTMKKHHPFIQVHKVKEQLAYFFTPAQANTYISDPVLKVSTPVFKSNWELPKSAQSK